MNDLHPRADVPDIDTLAGQLIADVRTSHDGAWFLDALTTIETWQQRLTVEDYQLLVITLASRAAPVPARTA